MPLCANRRNTDTVLIPVKYLDIRTFICVNIILRFWFTDVSGTAADYGAGFDKSAISRMINFYQEFPDYEKVMTLSQLLTRLYFLVTLPIKDELQRDFYAMMCKNENWSVRTLRELKKSMLYECIAISKIKNEIIELADEKKMSLDMFYRDTYILDFLGLNDTYSEKDLENAMLAQLEKFILEMGSIY